MSTVIVDTFSRSLLFSISIAEGTCKSLLRFGREYLSCTREPLTGILSYSGGDFDRDFEGRRGDDFLTSMVYYLCYWSEAYYLERLS